MNKEFVAALPNKFVENTRTLCGERGEKWLNDLPDTIAALEKEWNITAAGHFRNLSYNYVANASLSDGTPAVIKVALPLNDVEIYGEAAYLQAIDGHGAVECLRFDRERQAVLLDGITPGVNLRSECRKDRERAVGVGIDLLKRLLRLLYHCHTRSRLCLLLQSSYLAFYVRLPLLFLPALNRQSLYPSYVFVPDRRLCCQYLMEFHHYITILLR